MSLKPEIYPAACFLLITLFLGCGNKDNVYPYPDTQNQQMIPLWLGTYSGTTVYTFGDITDEKGGEGFPATLKLREYAETILFDLTTHHQGITYKFSLPPTVFASRKIEFIRNAFFEGREYQYQISMTLSDMNLTGNMKMFSRTQDGTLARRGSYLFTLTKNFPE